MQLVEFFDFFLIQFSIFPQTVNLLLGLFGEIVRNSLFQFCQSFRTIYKRHHVEHLQLSRIKNCHIHTFGFGSNAKEQIFFFIS